MTARNQYIRLRRPTRRTATFGGILLAALLAVSARAQGNGKIAFTREPYDTFTKNNIWVRDLDAGTTTMVTDDGAMDYEAKWTRDGKRLAFRSLARSPHTATSIWVKELASGSITPATDDTANDFMPGWVPEATRSHSRPPFVAAERRTWCSPWTSVRVHTPKPPTIPHTTTTPHRRHDDSIRVCVSAAQHIYVHLAPRRCQRRYGTTHRRRRGRRGACVVVRRFPRRLQFHRTWWHHR
jgi:hypothetical protein